MDAIDQLAEDLCLLGKFGELPVVVFVMVLEDQGDAILRRVGNAGLNALGGVANAFRSAHLGTALSTENATIFAAQRCRHINPAFFQIDLLLAKSFIGMRK